jgi:hypothetical protein
VDIRASGIEILDGLLHPIAQSWNAAKLPENDRRRLTWPWTVISTASHEYYK